MPVIVESRCFSSRFQRRGGHARDDQASEPHGPVPSPPCRVRWVVEYRDGFPVFLGDGGGVFLLLMGIICALAPAASARRLLLSCSYEAFARPPPPCRDLLQPTRRRSWEGRAPAVTAVRVSTIPRFAPAQQDAHHPITREGSTGPSMFGTPNLTVNPCEEGERGRGVAGLAYRIEPTPLP